MYICIDIGGTKTIIAGFSGLGPESKKFERIFLTEKNYERQIQKLVNEISKETEEGEKIDALAACQTGIIDEGAQICTFSLNLPDYANRNIASDLASLLGSKRFILLNDLIAAAIAETNYGVGRMFDRFMYFTISTSLGAAYVSKDGKGKIDTLRPIESAFFNIIENSQISSIDELVSGRSIEQKFNNKPENIDELLFWEKQTDYYVTAIVNSLVMVNVEALVLGGGMIEGNEYLRAKIVQKIPQELRVKKVPSIHITKMAKQVALYGALGAISTLVANS